MKKIVVTGAAGYIGSVACHEFLKQGLEIVAIDNLSAGFRQPLQILQEKFGSGLRFYKKDLRENLDTIFSKEKNIDAVIHFAGVCVIDESMQNPTKYFSNNVTASQNLFDTMVRFNIPKIIFSSSCSVYKDTSSKVHKETSPVIPSSPYGESKLAVEKMLQWYSKVYGINYIAFRYFNVCGAEKDGMFGDSKNPSHLLVHNAIMGALTLRPFYVTYPEFQTEDKSPVRDYVNVLDLIDAHLKGLNFLSSTSHNTILNIGTGVGLSVQEIIREVEKITNVTLPVKRTNTRSGEYPRRVAANAAIRKTLHWKPQYSLEDSIYSALLWYKKHPNRWL